MGFKVIFSGVLSGDACDAMLDSGICKEDRDCDDCPFGSEQNLKEALEECE